MNNSTFMKWKSNLLRFMTGHDFVQPADKRKNVLVSFAEQRQSAKKLRKTIHKGCGRCSEFKFCSNQWLELSLVVLNLSAYNEGFVNAHTRGPLSVAFHRWIMPRLCSFQLFRSTRFPKASYCLLKVLTKDLVLIGFVFAALADNDLNCLFSAIWSDSNFSNF